MSMEPYEGHLPKPFREDVRRVEREANCKLIELRKAGKHFVAKFARGEATALVTMSVTSHNHNAVHKCVSEARRQLR